MTSSSPLSEDAADDVIEQDRSAPPRWLCVTAGAAAAAVASAAVLHAALPVHRARAVQVGVTNGAAALFQPALQAGFCAAPVPDRRCWPRQPFAAVACSLPARGASASGPAEALLVRRTHRYSVLVGSACQ